jgi:hypothetical protein
MLSSITQLQRVHLATATGLVWNYSLRMVLKGKALTLECLYIFVHATF